MSRPWPPSSGPYQPSLAYSQAAPYAGGDHAHRRRAELRPGPLVRPPPGRSVGRRGSGARTRHNGDPVKSLSIAGVTKSFGVSRCCPGSTSRFRRGRSRPFSGRRAAARPPCCGSSQDSSGPTRARSAWAAEVVDDAGHRFVPCEQRRIGYVPQEGALFPHLSVGRNVAFGLARDRAPGHPGGRAAGTGRPGRPGPPLPPPTLRRPAAAGRPGPRPGATAPRSSSSTSRSPPSTPRCGPRVRAEVHDVLRLAGATSILVTHDQDEALSMADQVAILRGGVIAQINTPSSLYRAAPRRRAGPVPGRGQPGRRARPAGRWCRPRWASWRWRPARGDGPAAPATGPRHAPAEAAVAGRRPGQGDGPPRAAASSTRPARRGSRAWSAATSTSATMPWCGCSRTIAGTARAGRADHGGHAARSRDPCRRLGARRRHGVAAGRPGAARAPASRTGANHATVTTSLCS